ncbi:MAG: glycosyltransferase family 4 protein [Anaerolineae bacterium]|nr:glycosyltransferase family 4 protein [Anaerolineae bacterium]
MQHNFSKLPLHIGFVSTRFHGTDGVSLETEKWADVLENMGHKCFYFAGSSDRPPEISFVVPEASFSHPTIAAVNTIVFNEPWLLTDLIESLQFGRRARQMLDIPTPARPPQTTRAILEVKDHLRKQIHAFVDKYAIQLLISENALTIPMNIPLGLALTEFIAETGLPTIAHHHDFYWERKRFLVNSVGDYLRMSFPPVLPSIRHVVINSWAANEMSLRTGASATIIPNVMHFEQQPPPPDDYMLDLRADLGLEDKEHLILQPTRVVQRKGIEHAIELVKRMGVKARLVISHAAGDEGDAYEQRVREFAEMLKVKTLFVEDIIRPQRGQTGDGRKVYALADVYSQADLVTYPSNIEGFGNAFLEATYFRRPLVVNNYSIYAIDIKPKGFRAIEFDGFVSDETVERARDLLREPKVVQEMAEHNYQLGKRYFSYRVLERHLSMLIGDYFGEMNHDW